MIQLQQRIGYTFKDADLLTLACVLPTCFDGCIKANNQRLEFFGDSVLGMFVAERLYHLYPDAQEGVLTDMRLHLVSGVSLAKLGHRLGLQQWVVSEKSHFDCGILRDKPMADVVEAIFGAAWLDGGCDAVRTILDRFFTEEDWREIQHCTGVSDNPKGQLLEWAQINNQTIAYEVVSQTGSAHEPHFVCQVSVGPYKRLGEGKNKKTAQAQAAQQVLNLIRNSF